MGLSVPCRSYIYDSTLDLPERRAQRRHRGSRCDCREHEPERRASAADGAPHRHVVDETRQLDGAHDRARLYRRWYIVLSAPRRFPLVHQRYDVGSVAVLEDARGDVAAAMAELQVKHYRPGDD